MLYKRLAPLLDIGREREGIDLSKLTLTHHNLKNKGRRAMLLGGEAEPLDPITDNGGSEIHEK